MLFPRKVRSAISFTSSEGSGLPINPYAGYICQDPSIKMEIPSLVILPPCEMQIIMNCVMKTRLLNTLRRGLILIRVLSNLNDPEITEWVHAIKVVTDTLDKIRTRTSVMIHSIDRWKNILCYITRSRRFVTWHKIMRHLGLLSF